MFQRLSAQNLDLLPSTVYEAAAPSMPPVPRMRFASSDEAASVNVGLRRIDIFRQSLHLDNEVHSNEQDFAIFVEQVLRAILPDGQATFARLASVTTWVSPAESAARLNDVLRSISRPTPSFQNGEIADWGLRVNANRMLQIGGRDERINAIQKVERVQGQMLVQPNTWLEFDRVFLELDLNTSVNDLAPRFNLENMAEFLAVSSPVMANLRQELVDLIGLEL